MRNKNHEELLTQDQAAVILHVRSGTLCGWRFRNVGPRYIKVGGLVYYKRADVEAFLRDGLVVPLQRPVRARLLAAVGA